MGVLRMSKPTMKYMISLLFIVLFYVLLSVNIAFYYQPLLLCLDMREIKGRLAVAAAPLCLC